MFKEHDYIIWGTMCSCGNECYILQNKHHPWSPGNYKVRIKCNHCNKAVEINQAEAAVFYNDKIYGYYEDVTGTVLDLGCGGGFLTEHLIARDDVKKVYTIDTDVECRDEVEKLAGENNNIEFRLLDIKDIGENFNEQYFDYIVSRDAFMFVNDPDKYFDDVTKLAKKGVRQMGWFISDNPRMNNKMHPDRIADEFEKRNWNVELETLDWYASGYFIRADKRKSD